MIDALALSLFLRCDPGALAALQAATVNPRPRMLERLARSVACYPQGLTGAQIAALEEEFDLRPPALGEDAERFFVDTLVWTGDLSTGPSGRAIGATLTYSFPADGVTWGLSQVSSVGPNILNAAFATEYGSVNLDMGRELVRQALASWSAYTGLRYREVADDNTAMGESSVRSAARGDIRVGGRAFGTTTFLAYNAFPTESGLSTVGGGDMLINTSHFIPTRYSNPDDNYRYLRNTVAHEHGHGTGNIHATPCDQTKLMEPFINVNFDALAIDELRGGTRNYGDRFAGNHSAPAAQQFGDLSAGGGRSVLQPGLSLNGAAGFGGTGEDWFAFSLSSPSSVTISAAPVGGSYANGQQTASCNPTTPPTIDASAAGNISLELRDASGASVLLSAASQPAGVSESIDAGELAPGSYTVRVVDIGPNPVANQTVQLYDLAIRVDDAPARPLVVAGIDKRITAQTNCFFMGDINSRVTEPGATLGPESYDWDLDADGVFETVGQAQPVFVYPSNGLYGVTLRVTDSLGSSDTHTIGVTVFGATTVVDGVFPATGQRGQTVPVVIEGANLKNVSSAAEFTVAGGGVAVVGTPVPNALGTQVTGLSLQIASDAALGPRTLSVNNADGSGSRVAAFSITAPEPGDFALLSPADGAVTASKTPMLSWGASGDAASYRLVVQEDTDDDGSFDITVIDQSGPALLQFTPAPGVLRSKRSYSWSVEASNTAGVTQGTGAPREFRTPVCAGDADDTDSVDFNDISEVLARWEQSYPSGRSGPGDADGNSLVDFDDITAILSNWLNLCP